MSYLDEFDAIYDTMIEDGKDETTADEQLIVQHITREVTQRLRVIYYWHEGRHFETAVDGYNALIDPVITHITGFVFRWMALGILVGRNEVPCLRAAEKSNDWKCLVEDADLIAQADALGQTLAEETAFVERLQKILRARGDDFVEDCAMEQLPEELKIKFWDCFVMLVEAGTLVMYSAGRIMGAKETGAEEFDDIVKRIIGGEGLPGADS